MLELVFEFIVEVVIQLFGEVLLDWFGQARRTRREVATASAVVGYSALGALVGVLSLKFFPHHFIRNETYRIVALVAGPVTVGLLMSAIGRWRLRRGDTIIRIDRFAYAAVFALAVSLVRWWFAE